MEKNIDGSTTATAGSKVAETNKKFVSKINFKANQVAIKNQIYFARHNVICFKYNAAKI